MDKKELAQKILEELTGAPYQPVNDITVDVDAITIYSPYGVVVVMPGEVGWRCEISGYDTEVPLSAYGHIVDLMAS